MKLRITKSYMSTTKHPHKCRCFAARTLAIK